MSNIVPLFDKEIDIEKPFPIAARDLWVSLGIQDDFSTWTKDQLNRAHLIENTDYIIFREKPVNSKPGRPRLEYLLTISAAKEIAMISNTPLGKKYRLALVLIEQKYFGGERYSPQDHVARETPAITVLENRLRVCQLLTVPVHLGQIEACKHTLKLTGIDFSPVLKLSSAQNEIKVEEVMLDPTECALELGFQNAAAFNRKLATMGLQVKTEDSWVALGEARENSCKHSWVRGSKSGYNLKWRLSWLKTNNVCP